MHKTSKRSVYVRRITFAAALLIIAGVAAHAIEDDIEAIVGPDAEARFEAAADAGPLGAEAVEPLVPHLDDEDGEIRRAAREALQRIVMHAGRPDADDERAAVAQALAACLTDDYTVDQRREALELLSMCGGEDEVEAIEPLLRDPELIQAACRALVRNPSHESVRALVRALDGADEEMAKEIAHALAQKATAAAQARSEKPWVVYQGFEGPGEGKHIVLVSGDEEYRSEEALPQLGKILAVRHGFTCTVLFAIDPETGEINPNQSDNIPGLEALETADLMIIATRFRDLPDEQMRYIADYVERGGAVIGLRTATHAFNIPADASFAHYSFNSEVEDWEGGFGRQVLGETWITHHGSHSQEATRGVIADDAADHPILNGVNGIFGPTNVYRVTLPLPGDSETLVLGEVVDGTSPDDPAVEGEKNDPMMPIAWKRTYELPGGEPGRAFTTTMGASQDLESEGLRRLLVNAAYWAAGLEDAIPSEADVRVVGTYEPTPFGFDAFTEGVKPSAHAL